MIEVSSHCMAWMGRELDPWLDWRARHGWGRLVGEALVVPGSAALCQLLSPGRRTLPGQRVWPGCGPCRVKRPGLARAGLRGDAGPTIFEEDPGSVACPGFIPPTTSEEKVKSFSPQLL